MHESPVPMDMPAVVEQAQPRHGDPAPSRTRALRTPVVHALGGKEHVEWDNPCDVGMTGLIGFSSGYKAVLNGRGDEAIDLARTSLLSGFFR